MAEPTENNLSDYLQDIGAFVKTSAEQVADTDQEFMDEYYNEYPEKGILSAFPEAGAKLFNFIKNNPKALAFNYNQTNNQVNTDASLTGPKTKFSLGRSRYEGGPSRKKFILERDVGKYFKVTAGSEGGDKFANLQVGIPFMADGGELSNLNEVYNLLNPEYVTREGLNPDTPKLDAFAKALLPVNEDGTLNYGEAAMAMTPLGWVARLDKINDARRIANKQFKVGVALSSPSEQAAAKKVLDRLKRQEVDEFTPKQLSEYAAMQNKKVGTEVAAKEGIATLRGTLETAGEVAQKTAEQANIKGSAQGLDALFNALNK